MSMLPFGLKKTKTTIRYLYFRTHEFDLFTSELGLLGQQKTEDKWVRPMCKKTGKNITYFSFFSNHASVWTRRT